MVLAAAAVERPMKIQHFVMRALSGAITWLQAAEILGLHPRSIRRWRARFEHGGTVALYDRRCLRPSRRQAPASEVQRILELYRGIEHIGAYSPQTRGRSERLNSTVQGRLVIALRAV